MTPIFLRKTKQRDKGKEDLLDTHVAKFDLFFFPFFKKEKIKRSLFFFNIS